METMEQAAMRRAAHQTAVLQRLLAADRSADRGLLIVTSAWVVGIVTAIGGLGLWAWSGWRL